MVKGKHGWTRGAILAATLGAAGLASSGSAQIPGSFGVGPFPQPAQNGQGFGQTGQGFGQSGPFAQGNFQGQFPGGGSRFQGNQFPGGGPGGSGRQQGGVFSLDGSRTLASNATVRMAAFCTDLLSEPPDAGTRYTGGDTARVLTADGRSMTLAQALTSGAVALRGRSDSFDPTRRDGSLALDLYLTNTGDAPVQVMVAAGTAITPKGQGAQPLPAGSERLFEVAGARRLALSNTMQHAIWAARGSTAEEVEQANMIKLPTMEIGRVQGLLNESGIRQDFDRNRGLYGAQYEEVVEKLGEKAEKLAGAATIPIGGAATVEGVRGPDGKGFVSVFVKQSRARFYYGADFSEGKNGRTKVSLKHLITRRPIRANGGGFEMTATTPAT